EMKKRKLLGQIVTFTSIPSSSERVHFEYSPSKLPHLRLARAFGAGEILHWPCVAIGVGPSPWGWTPRTSMHMLFSYSTSALRKQIQGKRREQFVPDGSVIWLEADISGSHICELL